MHTNSLAHMQLCVEHVDDILLHTNMHTYIHKYNNFLIGMISVGLALARPNYCNMGATKIRYSMNEAL